jgi:RNA polymerase sigma factor (sigma-70 family)
VEAARAGDPDAWARLVQRFDRMLRSVARSYHLPPADVDDVVQTTWLDLFETLERLREPMAIGGWLATATRHNALRRRRMRVREQPTDDPQLGEGADDNQPEASLLAVERRAALAAAIDRLPRRHRGLLIVLLTQPTLEYREVGELLSMPVGSIGPTRARSLARLACDTQLRAVADLPAAA